ncbi:MAG: aminotransferase class V-fold PLP-dependent enzyme [Opitutaceae bacterium]|nr:aminotransferase class V-fold PLP-dependent enzyme [Opitutaceae bacterium]
MAYFDHNSTSPLSHAARAAWDRSVNEEWANPSALYRSAAKARLRLDVEREKLADYLGAAKERLIFNSGATEGANSVVGYLSRRSAPGSRLLIAATEHTCVLTAATRHFGDRIETLPLVAGGVVDIAALAGRIRAGGVAAVCVMAANNETGALQPWQQIAELCRSNSVPYLCDATQWLGKLPASGLGACDWLIASAHKWGGPRGVGLLLRAGAAEDFGEGVGGGQENGHRGGTEDVAGIHAAAEALVALEQGRMFLESDRQRVRDQFVRELKLAIPGVKVVAEGQERLWNTVLVLLPVGEQKRFVLKLDKLGHQVATGSACAAGKPGTSHVLTALGVDSLEASRALRFSSSWDTTEDDWRELLRALVAVSRELAGSESQVVQL